MRSRGLIPVIAWSAALAAVYMIVAKLGLGLGAVSGFATLVWPPTGISLAAMLLLGYRVWPGVAAGAFAVNLWTGASPAVALGIAAGNTGEALLGAFALQRFVSFRPSLGRLRDILSLIGFAAVGSTVVSASMGVASLWLGGVVATRHVRETWTAWWVGDMMGDLIVAPLVLAFLSPRHAWRDSPRLRVARVAEAVVLGVLLVIVSMLLFTWHPSDAFTSVRQRYMIFPLLIWAAVSFGIRGASPAVFVVSAIAVLGAVVGGGPFQGPELSASLLRLQTFMAVVATTMLILGSVSEERRQALAMRESLVALTAHELKTPLTSLLLRIQRLRRSLSDDAHPDADPSREAEALERLVKRVGRLVDDLLDVSRMAGDKLPLELEDVDLAVLAREVVDRLPNSQQSLISVVTSGGAIVGRWDRTRVDQIVTNLVSNALKYGEHKAVYVTVERAQENARLVVRDQGLGIAQRDLKRIFERFERAASKNVSGFGVGLWIVRQVVRSLGGRVEVTSREGAGTTFVVTLPMRERPRQWRAFLG